MKTELVKLSQVQINASNPRTISQEKFDKLIQSILILPKMLKLRRPRREYASPCADRYR